MQNLLPFIQGGELSVPEPAVQPKSPRKHAKEDEKAFLEEFFEDVEDLKGLLTTLNNKIGDYQKVCSNSVYKLTNSRDVSEATSQLDRLLNETNFTAVQINNKLRELRDENDAVEKKAAGTAEHRLRVNLHGHLSKKFVAHLKQFESIQADYKRKLRDKLGAQYKLVKPAATSEEIEEVIDAGVIRDLIADGLMKEKGKQKRLQDEAEDARDALEYVDSRVKEIYTLEQSIRELQRMLLDAAVLAKANGELMNDVAHNIRLAEFALKKGDKTMKRERSKHKCMIS